MKNIGQFFQENNGQYSATRLAFLAWVFGVLVVWGTGSIQAKAMQEIPDSVAILVGVLMTGKVAQKVSEVSGPDGNNELQRANLGSSGPNGNGAIPVLVVPQASDVVVASS